MTGARTSNPLFTGSHATAAYNSLFGTNAVGVPVEAGGGQGTALEHWRESVFGNELMTGWLDPRLSHLFHGAAQRADLGSGRMDWFRVRG